MGSGGKKARKDPTADRAIGQAGDTYTAFEMRRRARAREEADRLRNERLRNLRDTPDGAA